MNEAALQTNEFSADLYPTKEQLEAAFKVIRMARLPSIPDLVRDIRKEISQPASDLKKIAGLISQDPALAGQVLRIANSALYGARVEIESIQQAVVRLGVSQVANLVAAEAVSSLADDVGPEVRRIWESNVEEARAAVAVSAYIDNLSADEAYLLGMMHDVGNIIFARIRESLGNLKDRAYIAPVTVLDEERRLIGTDHTVIGFLMAKHWKLPEVYALAIYHHHVPTCQHLSDSKLRSLVALLKVVNYLTSLHLRDMELPEMIQYRFAARKELLIPPDLWEELLNEAAGGFHW